MVHIIWCEGTLIKVCTISAVHIIRVRGYTNTSVYYFGGAPPGEFGGTNEIFTDSSYNTTVFFGVRIPAPIHPFHVHLCVLRAYPK